MVSRTKMTINIQFGVSWGYGNSTWGSSYNIMSFWWVGKNNIPMFKELTTIERNDPYNEPSATPTFWYSATTTLIGGDTTTNVDFVTGDIIYFTGQQSGTAGALGSTVTNTRVNITWESLN